MKLQAKQRLTATAVPDLKTLKIDRWFDPSTRNWIVTLQDNEGNQVGESIVVSNGAEARGIKKDHAGFNLRDMDAENEARYGTGRKTKATAKIGPIKHGDFHKWLGRPESEHITDADIAKGKAAGGHAAKMAQFAENARKWKHK